MRSTESLPTLRSRVTLAAGAAAALVGFVAASTSALYVQRQQRTEADRRLIDAARLFAVELDTGHEFGSLADDENLELAHLGLHLGLFDGATWLGGEVTPAPTKGCVSAAGQRVCTHEVGSRNIVVRAPDPEIAVGVVVWAIVLATALAAIAGALTSRALAKWALGPLEALRERVAGARFDSALELGPRAPTEEVEALRAALSALLERFREAAERSKLFASGAAHELKTPLATMSAELELAQEASAEERTLAVQRVARTLRRLSLQVDRLLALARGDAGQPLTETVAMEDVAREAIAARPEQARLRLSVEDPGMVRGDSALLAAIADNLIDNALKFSGEEVVQVAVRARGGQSVLMVSDAGEGIAPERVEALLRPFARGSSTQPGHGLGLAIVHHAVERHGGTLKIEGATVTVSLPGWTGKSPRPPGGEG